MCVGLSWLMFAGNSDLRRIAARALWVGAEPCEQPIGEQLQYAVVMLRIRMSFARSSRVLHAELQLSQPVWLTPTRGLDQKTSV